jgi:NhaP-type Na+/H+ or K+/H+ antiporter
MGIEQTVLFVMVVSGCVCVYALVAQKLANCYLSPAMIFLVIGIVAECIRLYALKMENPSFPREGILPLAEITLSMILFVDISSIQFASLQARLPIRTLSIGKPLFILLTYFFIRGILPELGMGGALFLAGTLSPTDASLSAPFILSPGVPSLVRQSLNVESGLNDGIATPVVFIGLSFMKEGTTRLEPHETLHDIVYPLIYALVIGIIVGPLYAFLMDVAHNNKLCTKEGKTYMTTNNVYGRMSNVFCLRIGKALGLVIMPLFLWALSRLVGATIFVAVAIAAGFYSFFCRVHHEERELSELLEAVADFLSYVVWYLAGQFLVAAFSTGFRWEWLVIAFAVLVPLRMCTIAISLLFTGLDWRSQVRFKQ